jgi:prepilin-type N-terminal cleavage/methylation domain-containing protein
MRLFNNSGASQKGFTLIEMSIVLVIIGLIIGGILKGQEIIESSRQKNVLAEVERLRAATNTFVDRYRALPGDFALAQGGAGVGRITANAAVVNGDGDGIVNSAAVPPAGAAAITGIDAGVVSVAGTTEMLAFFNHLAAANLIGGTRIVDAATTTFGDGSPLPAAAFPGTGFSVIHGNHNNVANDALMTHWLRISKTPAGAVALSPKQMYSLDTRSDDGSPGQGGFRSGTVSANVCGAMGAVGQTDYAAEDETISCVALINLVQ